jgi:2-C-methyl-D-erythritol 4-phosphate cytidylyltransferase
VIWGAIVVAAGRGTRFGRPKQLVDLGGKPMIAWSVQTLAAMPEIVELVVVTEHDSIAPMRAAIGDSCGALQPRVVAGGVTRQESVRCGLAALSDHCAGVLVHDGARPLVRAHEIRAGMRVVRPGTAALLAARVIDTIKVVDAVGCVTRTLDRSVLWAAQTPQLAAARDLRRVHDDAVRNEWPEVTDDAALLERGGIDVVVVESSPDNFKVTLPGDLARASAILRERGPAFSDETEVFIVECFVPPRDVDAVLGALEARGARIDGIDRDLPAAVAVRAFAGRAELRGFGNELYALAGEDAIFTTHLSHLAPHA